MKQRIVGLLSIILLTPLLLLSGNIQHSQAASNMSSDHMMSAGDCLSSCNSRNQLSEVLLSNREIDKDKEKEPQTAEPYYLQFINFAFTVSIVSAAYLLRYLRWRPPDLYKLNVVYRF